MTADQTTWHSDEYIEPLDRPTTWAHMATELAAEGRSTTEIARSLCIDEATVVLLLAEATT